MKKGLVLTLIIIAAGCGTIPQRMATMEESGRILGFAAVEYVVAEHGVHSRKAEDVAQIGRGLDDAAVLLAKDEPVAVYDTLQIRRLITDLVEVIQGDPLENEVTAAAAAAALGDVLDLLRDATVNAEARTLAAVFCANVAGSIYAELDQLRLEETGNE